MRKNVEWREKNNGAPNDYIPVLATLQTLKYFWNDFFFAVPLLEALKNE